MSKAWSARGADYAVSPLHKRGPSLAKLLALARPHPNDVCLDIGTGAGHTAALAPLAAQVIGFDPSKGMLRAARKLYGAARNLEFVLAPAHDTGLRADSFDLITARHTLHHHPDLAAILNETARLLKPGGRLVIVDEVTPDNNVDTWFSAVERARDPTHVRAYSMAEWQAFVAGAGMAWIVGDSETRYAIDVASWLERMNPDTPATEAVYNLFGSANAREVFSVEYEGAQAVRFEMPMALILALKPV
jgi:SAM-dependent methyltransferase